MQAMDNHSLTILPEQGILGSWRTALALSFGKVPSSVRLLDGLNQQERLMVSSLLAGRAGRMNSILSWMPVLGTFVHSSFVVAGGMASIFLINVLQKYDHMTWGMDFLLLSAGMLSIAMMVLPVMWSNRMPHIGTQSWPHVLCDTLRCMSVASSRDFPPALASLHKLIYRMSLHEKARVGLMLADTCGAADLISMSRVTCALRDTLQAEGKNFRVTLTGDVDEMVCRMHDAIVAEQEANRSEKVRQELEKVRIEDERPILEIKLSLNGMTVSDIPVRHLKA